HAPAPHRAGEDDRAVRACCASHAPQPAHTPAHGSSAPTQTDTDIAATLGVHARREAVSGLWYTYRAVHAGGYGEDHVLLAAVGGGARVGSARVSSPSGRRPCSIEGDAGDSGDGGGGVQPASSRTLIYQAFSGSRPPVAWRRHAASPYLPHPRYLPFGTRI